MPVAGNPPKYTRGYSFAGHSASQPTVPQPGNKHDQELDDIAFCIGEFADNLGAAGDLNQAVQDAEQAAADAIAAASASSEAAQSVTERIYPGTYASDPVGKPEGGASLPGDMYFNSGIDRYKTFDGSLWWEDSLDAALLASSAGAGMMGYVHTGAGALLRMVEDRLRDQPVPGDFGSNDGYVAACKLLATHQNFAQNGARIARIPDRLLIGNATDNDGMFPNVQRDWMTAYQVDISGLGQGSICNAALASLTVEAPSSNFAAVFGAQSRYCTGANASTIGLMAYALNNNGTLATRAWGAYIEAIKDSPTATGIRGAEIDVAVRSATPEPIPYPSVQTLSSSLQLGAGIGLGSSGLQNVGACIQVVNNPMKYRKGFVFLKDALEGTDGASGLGVAVAMAAFQSLDWYSNANALVGRVWAPTTTPGGELRFTSLGPLLQGANSLGVCRFMDVAAAVNSFQMIAAAAGGGPQLTVTGTDTNIDLRFTTQGTGVLRFGTLTASADAPVTGYITVKDAGGTVRKLAVIT